MDVEIKGLFDEQAKTFEAFKAKNDALQDQVKKLGEDAVTKDEVKKLNDALDAAADQIKAAIARNDEIEAKMNRMALSGGASSEAEVKAAGEFARQIGADFGVDELRGYKSAMDAYWRRGENARDLDMKALSVGSDPDGGYLVTPDTSGRIVAKLYESSPMRQVANVTSIGTDALEGIIDNDQPTASWVGETATRASTTTPQLGKWVIPVNELYAMPLATQKVLEDAKIDLEGWLAMKVSDLFARKENTAFVSGTGGTQPRGFLDYDKAATADATRSWGTLEYVATGSSGAFDTSSKNGTEKLISLIYKLKAGYRGNASFMMNRATVGTIRGLKDSTYQYIWQPSAQAGQPATLFGFPVFEAEDMPDIAADTYSVAFGDFREAYTIVDRVGISVLRDPYSTKGYVGFYTRKRTGGGLVNSEALKLLKFGTS